MLMLHEIVITPLLFLVVAVVAAQREPRRKRRKDETGEKKNRKKKKKKRRRRKVKTYEEQRSNTANYFPTDYSIISSREHRYTTTINILNASPVYAARVLDPRSDLSWNVMQIRPARIVRVPPESPRVITVYYADEPLDSR